MARSLKVYGWQSRRPDAPGTHHQVRAVVAATSMAAAARAAGEPSPRSLFNLTETGNAREIEVAMAEPGTVFWAPLVYPFGPFVRWS